MRLAVGIATAWAVIAVALSSPVAAQDACEKFAWPLARERQLFTAANIPSIASGVALASWPAGAVQIQLSKGAERTFVLPPERRPRDGLFAGVAGFPAPMRAGIYQITVSDDGWIDLVQAGRYVRAIGSSGRRDCLGLRKSVRVDLGGEPFAFQISGVESSTVTVVIAAVE